jgi:ABC-type Zn uptake system ZnuABC Zn-binding protein ZnuA
MLLSEQLREIINRMQESDRKTQELLEASAKRFKEKLAELDKLNKQFD